MSFFNTLAARTTVLVNRIAEQVFDLGKIDEEQTRSVVDRCLEAYHGTPDWILPNSPEHSINFTKTICEELARLTTMNIKIDVDGSARAEWLSEQIHLSDRQYRRWVELGCAAGLVIVKPNGATIDLYLPGQYLIVKALAGEITEIVFQDIQRVKDTYYTKLEYHKRVDGEYTVQNRCFISKSKGNIGDPIDIKDTPWSDLAEDVLIENVDHNLFGSFFMPSVNNDNLDSCVGLPIVANCLVELEGLDNAFYLLKDEIDDSQRIVMLDSDRLMYGATAQVAPTTFEQAQQIVEMSGLPKYVKLVEGSTSIENEIYHEINPNLNTETRIKGINNYLSQIGFKTGFSNGYFVFDQKTGMITATQVESDDRRTIQTINDIRRQFRACIDELVYALNAFADAYGLAPRGEYEITYEFDDITLNEEEDRARWYGYVQANHVPFWYYLVKFEGYSEDEAKELEELAQVSVPIYPEEE